MRWTGLLPLGVIVACGPAGAPRVDVLLEADRAFARATAANGTESWVTTFTEDGMMFNGSQPVVGHGAIRDFMGPAFDSGNFSLTWDPVAGEISGSGDLGYTRGRWESRATSSDGSEIVRIGMYVTIWRLNAEGEWRVALDIGAPDEPPESAAP